MRRETFSRWIWYITLGGLLLVAVLADVVHLTTGTVGLILLSASLELMDSSLGMGYGTTLTPILLLCGFQPLQLVPTILVSEFLSGFASSFFHSEAGNVTFRRGSPDSRAAVTLSICSILGVVAGVQLAFQIPALTLRRIIGAVILLTGLYILAVGRRTFRFGFGKIVVLAVAASFNKAVSGGGYGPLMTSGQIVSGISGRAAVAITSLAEGFTCLGGAVLFLVQGESLDLQLLGPVVLGALSSVPVSARLVRRVPEHRMKQVIAVLTIVMGLLTLLKTL